MNSTRGKLAERCSRVRHERLGSAPVAAGGPLLTMNSTLTARGHRPSLPLPAGGGTARYRGTQGPTCVAASLPDTRRGGAPKVQRGSQAGKSADRSLVVPRRPLAGPLSRPPLRSGWAAAPIASDGFALRCSLERRRRRANGVISDE